MVFALDEVLTKRQKRKRDRTLSTCRYGKQGRSYEEAESTEFVLAGESPGEPELVEGD